MSKHNFPDCFDVILPKSKLLASLKSLLKLVNTTAGINELLLTGEEGMAL